jgi:hypothetical protein
MVDNKPVPMTFGQQVNPGFNYADHVRDRIEYDPRRKLIIGMDQGLFAAAVAQQRTPMGEIRTLRECVFMREDGKALEKIGPTAFGKAVKAMLADNFARCAAGLDPRRLRPAAFNAGERSTMRSTGSAPSRRRWASRSTRPRATARSCATARCGRRWTRGTAMPSTAAAGT